MTGYGLIELVAVVGILVFAVALFVITMLDLHDEKETRS